MERLVCLDVRETKHEAQIQGERPISTQDQRAASLLSANSFFISFHSNSHNTQNQNPSNSTSRALRYSTKNQDQRQAVIWQLGIPIREETIARQQGTDVF